MNRSFSYQEAHARFAWVRAAESQPLCFDLSFDPFDPNPPRNPLCEMSFTSGDLSSSSKFALKWKGVRKYIVHTYIL